jgi:hypothetical protein
MHTYAINTRIYREYGTRLYGNRKLTLNDATAVGLIVYPDTHRVRANLNNILVADVVRTGLRKYWMYSIAMVADMTCRALTV